MQNLIEMVRVLIGDMEIEKEFNDFRIAKSLATAGVIVGRETSLSRNYLFDLSNGLISPDPSDPETYDPKAMALISLKAACILNQNQYQGAIASGIVVREGSSMVDTTGSFSGYKDILNVGPCASYKTLLAATVGSPGAIGRLVGYYEEPRAFFDSYLQTIIPVPTPGYAY